MEHVDRQGHLTGTLAERCLGAADWFQSLRDSICAGFEEIEAEAENTQIAREKNNKQAALSVRTGNAMTAVVARFL